MKKSQEKLKAEYMAEAEAMFDELMKWDDENFEPDLTQIEDIVLKLRKRFGEQMAQAVIQMQEKRQPAEKIKCPDCGREMVTKGEKSNQVETRVGGIQIERGYFYCPECKQGIFPPGSAAEDLGETME
jgi:uncharacterized protein with PIN domain